MCIFAFFCLSLFVSSWFTLSILSMFCSLFFSGEKECMHKISNTQTRLQHYTYFNIHTPNRFNFITIMSNFLKCCRFVHCLNYFTSLLLTLTHSCYIFLIIFFLTSSEVNVESIIFFLGVFFFKYQLDFFFNTANFSISYSIVYYKLRGKGNPMTLTTGLINWRARNNNEKTKGKKMPTESRATGTHKIPTDSHKHSAQFKTYKTNSETTDQDGFGTFLFKLS